MHLQECCHPTPANEGAQSLGPGEWMLALARDFGPLESNKYSGFNSALSRDTNYILLQWSSTQFFKFAPCVADHIAINQRIFFFLKLITFFGHYTGALLRYVISGCNTKQYQRAVLCTQCARLKGACWVSSSTVSQENTLVGFTCPHLRWEHSGN